MISLWEVILFFTKYILIVNLISAAMISLDKMLAIMNCRRISEKTLCIPALAGGWIGGYAAMFYCNHKVKKPTFRVKYQISTFVNIVIVAFLVATLRASARVSN